MYEVMGGLNSVVLWEKNGLAQRDKVHFTREGYLLLGDLFSNALMQNFEDYLRNKNQLTKTSHFEGSMTEKSLRTNRFLLSSK
jgi:hypothetical protein